MFLNQPVSKIASYILECLRLVQKEVMAVEECYYLTCLIKAFLHKMDHQTSGWLDLTSVLEVVIENLIICQQYDNLE